MAKSTAPALRQMRDEGSSGADALLWHDLRAAITDVIGGADLIDGSRLDPQSDLQLQRIQVAGQMLLDLVAELEQPQSGAPQDTSKVARLFEFARGLERRWGARAAAMGRDLMVEMAANLPPVVSTNPLKLNRILSNLLNNALVHGRTGPVHLRVDMRSDLVLRITVSDQGQGFSKGALAALFEGTRFQGSKTGSGRGLLIARQLAKDLGGQVTFTNGPNGGAEVALLLPSEAWRLTAEAMAETLGEGPTDLPNLAGYRVLVAEDNPTNQLVIGQSLERLGAEYQIASNGIDALAMAKAGGFDLALVDIEMPGISGIDVIERIRDCGCDVAQMPLLAITAYVLRTHRDRIYAAGADGILAKPIMGLQQFGEALSALLSRTSAPSEPPKPSEPPDPTEPTAAQIVSIEGALFNPARLTHLLNITGPTMGEELMTRLNRDFAAVRAGLGSASAPPSAEDLRRHTHVLVSLSGAIGAEHMQHLAQALNDAAHREDGPGLHAKLNETTAWLDRLLLAFRQETDRRKEAPAS